MTRWQKFAWALAYTLLTALMAWAFVNSGSWLFAIPGASFLDCWLIAAFSEIPVLGHAIWFLGMALAAGLLIAPVSAAFRWYLPLYIVMGADVLAKALVILDAVLENSPGLLLWAIPGLVLAVIVLILTVRKLREPERTEKSVATPCKSGVGDV